MNCYLSLGANLGDKRKNLRQAIELISQTDGVGLMSVSHFYETEPWGVVNQPNFINAAVRIKSELEPLELLDVLQSIENKLGRVRKEHWGTRTIDIDILEIDDLTINDERLKIPHPFMLERDFVLVPLSELNGVNYKLHGDKIVKTHGCLTDFDLKIIACVDKNWGLGFNGQLLFNIAEDMKHFRELTLNNTVIMGRKTFDSIGKPLDNRRNIIISQTLTDTSNINVVNSLEGLYDKLNSLFLTPSTTPNSAFLIPNSELFFIIGGGEIYRQLLPFVREAYITVVNEIKPADVHLENLDNRDDFVCDSVDKHGDFEFRHYFRSAINS